MVGRNEFTGNALMSKPSSAYGENFAKVDLSQQGGDGGSLKIVSTSAGLDRYIQDPERKRNVENEKVFEVFHCSRCHVKVSTSNRVCPGCQENLPNGKEPDKKCVSCGQDLPND